MSISRTCLFLILVLAVSAASAQPARFMSNLSVYPDNVTMEAGDMITFTAVSTSHSGMMQTPEALRWFATGGTIDQNGRYVAGQNGGYFTVTVKYGGRQGTARVQIKTFAKPIVRVVVTPNHVTLRQGQSRQFYATAYDSYGQQVAFTPNWQSTGGGSINDTGYFQARYPGTFTVTATDPGTNNYGTATVIVGGGHHGGQIARIQVFPGNAQVQSGQYCNFNATAYDNYGRQVPANFKWSASGGNIDHAGRFISHSPGHFTIWAKVRGSGTHGTASVHVTGGHGPGPGPNPPHNDGRMVISSWDVGGGNMFRPKAKIRLTTYGQRIQTVKLYAVSPSGHYDELQAFSCSNGSSIYFDTKYDRFSTKWLEVRLYDNRGNVVARDKRSAD